MSEKKVCTNCENKEKEHSTEWSLSKELAKSNKRMFIINIILVVLLVLTIVLSMYERLQYDYETYEVQQDGQWGNTFIDGGNEGDINYGAENTSKETNSQKP